MMNQQSLVTGELSAVYDKMLLERIVPDTLWDKWGSAKTIPANSETNEAFAMRYKNILPSTVPLAEYNGTLKAPVRIVREKIKYNVEHFGEYIRYTDRLDLYDFRNIQSDFIEILGDNAALTMEKVRRDTVKSGTNVSYIGGTSTAEVRAAATNDALITEAGINECVLKLKAQGGKKFTGILSGTDKVGTTPIAAAYIGVCSIYTAADLERREDDGSYTIKGYKPVHEYAGNGALIDEREIGAVGQVRFVEDMNDEGNGTGADHIEQTIIMAKNAYATTTIRGKGGIQSKIKPLGSAGANDPLDQYGTIGWTAIAGATILNQAWIVRLEHKSIEGEDMSEKHYFDNDFDRSGTQEAEYEDPTSDGDTTRTTVDAGSQVSDS